MPVYARSLRAVSSAVLVLIFAAGVSSPARAVDRQADVVEPGEALWQWNNLNGRIGERILSTVDLDGDGDTELVVSVRGNLWNRVFVLESTVEGIRCSFPTTSRDIVHWGIFDIDGDTSPEFLFSNLQEMAAFSLLDCDEKARIGFDTIPSDTQLVEVAFGDIDADGSAEVFQVHGDSFNPDRIVVTTWHSLDTPLVSRPGSGRIISTGEYDNVPGTDLVVSENGGDAVLNGATLATFSILPLFWEDRHFTQYDPNARAELAVYDPQETVRVLDLLTGESLWTLSLPMLGLFIPVLADLDEIHEYLIDSDQGLRLFDIARNELGRMSYAINQWGAHTATDSTGNGLVEIIGAYWIDSSDHLLYSEPNGDGLVREASPRHDRPFRILPRADYDGDGISETLISYFGLRTIDDSLPGGLIAFSPSSGEERWRFQLDRGVMIGRPQAGDLDSDGVLEVCFGFDVGPFEHFVQCRNLAGTFEGWIQAQDSRVDNVWMHDADGDGDLDVLVAAGGPVKAYDGLDGSLLWTRVEAPQVQSRGARQRGFDAGHMFFADRFHVQNFRQLSTYSMRTGELLGVLEDVPEGLFASRDEIFYVDNGAVGIFDAETGALGTPLFDLGSPPQFTEMGVSPNGAYFYGPRCSEEGRVHVRTREGQRRYHVSCSSFEDIRLSAQGELLVADGFGVRRYRERNREALFSSDFEHVEY